MIFAGRVEETIPLWEPRAIWVVQAYVAMGKRAEAEKHATEYANNPWRVALVASTFGDINRAVEAVHQVAAAEPHRIGFLLVQPELAPIRDHPRVVALRKSLNVP